MAQQDDYVKTALRLPRHLHADATVAAQASGHSLNTELVRRIGQSTDVEHLHRVIADLSQSMKASRDHYGAILSLLLDELKHTIQVLDESLLLAQYKNGSQDDVQRLRFESNNARVRLSQLSKLVSGEFRADSDRVDIPPPKNP
jgi:hypothetical protein